MIHRDIKPENILLDAHGNAKISDFNVMKSLEETLAKTHVGSALYMAPEIIMDTKYSEKVDIYSICAVFYSIIKGKSPCEKESFSSPIQMMLAKREHSANYEELMDADFPVPEIVKLINFNLNAPPDSRMTASKILSILRGIDLSGLPNQTFDSLAPIKAKKIAESGLLEDTGGSMMMLGKKEMVQSSVVTFGNEGSNGSQGGLGGQNGGAGYGGGGGGLLMSSLIEGPDGDEPPKLDQIFGKTLRLDNLDETESMVFTTLKSFPPSFGASLKNTSPESGVLLETADNDRTQVSEIEEVPDDYDYEDDFDDGT